MDPCRDPIWIGGISREGGKHVNTICTTSYLQDVLYHVKKERKDEEEIFE